MMPAEPLPEALSARMRTLRASCAGWHPCKPPARQRACHKPAKPSDMGSWPAPEACSSTLKYSARLQRFKWALMSLVIYMQYAVPCWISQGCSTWMPSTCT
jgi:hypothetical protein